MGKEFPETNLPCNDKMAIVERILLLRPLNRRHRSSCKLPVL